MKNPGKMIRHPWAGDWEPPGPWVDQAVCAEIGLPDVWFPTADKGTIGSALPKRICLLCPVRAECLEYAMRHESEFYRFGVYGGTTPHQRRQLAREREMAQQELAG